MDAEVMEEVEKGGLDIDEPMDERDWRDELVASEPRENYDDQNLWSPILNDVQMEVVADYDYGSVGPSMTTGSLLRRSTSAPLPESAPRRSFKE